MLVGVFEAERYGDLEDGNSCRGATEKGAVLSASPSPTILRRLYSKTCLAGHLPNRRTARCVTPASLNSRA